MHKKAKFHPVYEETDKFKNEEGRKAFQEDHETEFLDKEALDEDILDPDDVEIDNHGIIIDSEHQENEEWHAREKQNEHRRP